MTPSDRSLYQLVHHQVPLEQIPSHKRTHTHTHNGTEKVSREERWEGRAGIEAAYECAELGACGVVCSVWLSGGTSSSRQ